VCSLCGMFREEHWAEPDASPGERGFRVEVMNRVLAPHGIRARDFNGSLYALSDGKGRTELASSLGQVWVKVETLLGRPVDPLT
jgi:hypothetical protein